MLLFYTTETVAQGWFEKYTQYFHLNTRDKVSSTNTAWLRDSFRQLILRHVEKAVIICLLTCKKHIFSVTKYTYMKNQQKVKCYSRETSRFTDAEKATTLFENHHTPVLFKTKYFIFKNSPTGFAKSE